MKKKTARKVKRFLVAVTALLLWAGTFVLAGWGSFNLARVDVKVIGIQAKLYHFYDEIDTANREHDSAYDTYLQYHIKAYLNMAEEADARADAYDIERTAYVESLDGPVATWAAEDGFSVLRCIGVFMDLVFMAFGWFFLIRKNDRLFELLVTPSLWIVNAVFWMFMVMTNLGRIVATKLYLICSGILRCDQKVPLFWKPEDELKKNESVVACINRDTVHTRNGKRRRA